MGSREYSDGGEKAVAGRHPQVHHVRHLFGVTHLKLLHAFEITTRICVVKLLVIYTHLCSKITTRICVENFKITRQLGLASNSNAFV